MHSALYIFDNGKFYSLKYGTPTKHYADLSRNIYKQEGTWEHNSSLEV